MEETMECEISIETSEKNATAVTIKEPLKPDVEEELLGSMTMFNNCDGADAKTQQLRTSARVYKKMKLDNAPSINLEKPDKKEDVKLEHKKSFRILWSSHDKDLFFEALNEYGKDFEGIYSYICSKSKKKGLPDHLMKTKDQVRHLYYRTWHKISKYLQFSEGIKKVAQELYGLINYGEMRRKLRFVRERWITKLQDLIYRGTIAVRDKGKTVRIKTPMCRALRRLNQLDERYDELKLPSRIVVDIKPRNMYSYLRVQSMAQNPRLRTVVPLQKRLSSIIVSVSKRWKTVEADIYDKAILSKNPVTNDCVPNEIEATKNKLLLAPSLRFTPPVDEKIELPTINLSEYFTRQSICLRAYENKLGIKNSESQLLLQNESSLKVLNKGLQRKAVKELEATTVEESQQPITAIKDVVSSILQLQNVLEGTLSSEIDIKVENSIPEQEVKKDDVIPTNKAANKIDEIRKGWTLSNCESISVGDLYLMFGKHSKLVLEYSWDEPKTSSDNLVICENVDDTSVLLENNSSTIQDNTVQCSENISQPENEWDFSISNSLKKLISIAKLHYRKNNNKCICGPVCSNKNNLPFKNKSTSKASRFQTCESNEYIESFSDDLLTDENAVDSDTVLPEAVNSSMVQSTFRRPATTTVPMVHLITQLDSIQKLKPRYRKSRRPRLNQMVVERQLSLLPNNTTSGQIVRMNIIPQSNKLNETTVSEEINSFSEQGNDTLIKSETFFQLQNITNIQNDVHEGTNCEDFTASALDSEITQTPSTSPSRLLKESDNQWLNAEVADFSLSSFLGHLDSPSKTLLSIPAANDDCAMNEETIS